jgi:hypothetical protein
MDIATLLGPVLNRKPGGRKLFQGEKLVELVEFMQDPDRTYREAAEHFNCSESLVSHTFQDLRRNAPALEQRGAADQPPKTVAS